MILIAIANVVISFFDSLLQIGPAIPFINFGTNLVVGTVAVTIMFRLLPDARVRWKDALIGATVTALLLSAGAKVVGWYIANGNIGSAFEAAGTVAVLLVSIYFLAQFFVFGVVFTRVFSEMYGGGIRPRNSG